ncbi:MAG: HAD hydrolase family protein [Candidatus Bathyarchaeota archaeon]|nr:HAD hydrolase family protein [Candidatus Bathyarchaeota archaeon]
MKRIFVTDCEGPISKNDNAYELAAQFIPNGGKLFSILSKYDDVLVDVFEKPEYTAGSTLKLILPFFKAYGITDTQMEQFSQENIVLIADTQQTMQHIQNLTDTFIVSTSYEHYIKALCNTINFPFKNTYCTKLRLDQFSMTDIEKEDLREVAQEIAGMCIIEIPPGAKDYEPFCERDMIAVNRLDEIFWDQMKRKHSGKIINDVVTVGGEQKAESIKDAAEKLDVNLGDVMYVGDSITDVEAFQLVRENGGLTVSFNGNSYAVRNAEVAVLAESNLVTAVLADLFVKKGKEETLKVITAWNPQTLENSGVDKALLKLLLSNPDGLPKVQIVTSQNIQTLETESSAFRKKVRGVAVGRLG